MSTHCFERVGDTVDRLGESPVWSQTDNALYWVDIRGPHIRRFDAAGGAVKSWEMPSLVGSIGLVDTGGLIVALRDRIMRFDPASGALTLFADAANTEPNLRFNDGRVDRQGRFWAGTMNDVTRAPVGELFRIGSDARLAAALDGVRCPNSLCWSPDGRRMYFADSDLRTIFVYDFDAASGTPTGKRVLVGIEGPAVPDGCVVDAEGYLWCALYGGGKIVRYDPAGRVDREIITPLSQPTSCCFGGADYRTLYITTASQRLSEEQLREQPLAGALLRLELAVAGLPESVFTA